MIDIYMDSLRRYAEFDGRSTRSQYWTFSLVNFFVIATLVALEIDIFFIPLALASFIPGITVGVRRLHDTGNSGLWLLVGLVPIVGSLILLFFLVKPSDPYFNEYGPEPKGGLAYA